MTTKVSKMPGRAGGSKDVDARLELLSGLMGKLDEIASAVAKIAAVVGTSTQADAPGAKFAARPATPPQTRQDAPAAFVLATDSAEVAAFAAAGAEAVAAARAVEAQHDSIIVGPRAAAAVRKMGGKLAYMRSHPDLAQFAAKVPADPVRVTEDVLRAPAMHPSLRPLGQARERSPRGAA